MKAANKQIENLLPEIPELVPPAAVKATRRLKLRALLALAAAGRLLRAPRLEREVAPGQPPLAEHEWRNRSREWIA